MKVYLLNQALCLLTKNETTELTKELYTCCLGVYSTRELAEEAVRIYSPYAERIDVPDWSISVFRGLVSPFGRFYTYTIYPFDLIET